ncbi:MAG: hypothetical protein A3C82_02875 [Candidatus Wildermuthbacteria bacterium RIFCSPHIGHO2_02_FULL_47_12]|uniref:Uncharacterized protein n=1 Tax=Candidatus Wildermuthbacteria bacterium RIFCSPHIGHO2_02_FULL_47_12 TaxID=1802451 RepID=A0A1G2R510_9BACT|nr:MAG: hypothetical protein A3C82_02875 [Candidatus Wildermuthbacteria bacterium RIFCSPHIGHO2_02_FULL_47_12]
MREGVVVARRHSAVVAKPNHRKRDLIFLVWPVNTCYIHLQAEVPKGVSLDLQKGVWTFQERSFPIGERDYRSLEHTGVPLGCYDRTKLNHLRTFQDAIEWVAGRNRPISFDD